MNVALVKELDIPVIIRLSMESIFSARKNAIGVKN